MYKAMVGDASEIGIQSRRLIRQFLNDESGATAIEYGLLCALMALACITAFSAVGGSNGGAWGATANKVANAGK